MSLIKEYLSYLRSLLIRPTQFFESLPLSGGVSGPLTFAIVTNWLGTAVQFLWTQGMSRTFGPIFDQFFQVVGDVAEIDHPGRTQIVTQFKERLYDWVIGAGSVLVDPFWTCFVILFSSALVFVGARLLINPQPEKGLHQVSYESALRLVCYAQAPAILKIFPFVGTLLASLMTSILLVIGARTIYRTTTFRAVMVGFFPQILLISLIFSGLFIGAIFMFKMISSFFMTGV